MKKTLIALAALAATASFAQVSVYGRLDVGYSNFVETKNNVETKATGIRSHNSVSSFWGIQGSEDLGGGLKAMFKLEQDVYPANGNTGVSGSSGGGTTAAGFNRTSTVGLSGAFGTIRAGRDYQPLYSMTASYDPMANSRVSTNNLSVTGSTVPNIVIYTTPNMSGFVANVSYINEDTSVGTTDAKVKGTNLTASYANGPLSVGVGVGNLENTAGTAVTKNEGSFLGASYDFGVAKLSAQLITTKNTSATGTTLEKKETNLGVTAPMGKVTLLAQLGRNTQTGDQGGNTDLSGNDWVIGADYALSAKTALYVKTGTFNKLEGTASGAAMDQKWVDTTFGIKSVF